jgi:hypothetical protein
LVDRIVKLENAVRILQRQVRSLSREKPTPPKKDEHKEDSDYFPIS